MSISSTPTRPSIALAPHHRASISFEKAASIGVAAEVWSEVFASKAVSVASLSQQGPQPRWPAEIFGLMAFPASHNGEKLHGSKQDNSDSCSALQGSAQKRSQKQEGAPSSKGQDNIV